MFNLIGAETIEVVFVAPVLLGLVSAVVYLANELRKSRKDKSELEEQFREREQEVGKKFTKTIHEIEENFRSELIKILKENSENSNKIVEALTKLNETQKNSNKEVEELARAFNDSQIKSSRKRRSSNE